MANQLTQHIQAFARLRPFSKQEEECNAKKCLATSQSDVTVHLPQNSRKYVFDKVFGTDSKQRDVYNAIVRPIIEEVMQGFNCTVFAYGQTGTGKTYTMVGSPSTVDKSYTQDSEAGIIPRTVGHIFEKYKTNPELELTVRVSYLELYNEHLIDLLSNEDKVLKIYEDQRHKGSVQIHGLEEVTVHDKNQVYEILQRGTEKRMTACTLMNVQSSRSHTVFTITLHSRESTVEGEEVVKTGKLNLVDLAGSEDISKSGAKDKRAREAGSINQSLLTLGRVIKALVDKTPHVPYRESKLTRILQDSLGGKTKTTIIATVSPASNNLEETISTLDYAHRARDITTRPEVNLKTTKTGVIQRYLKEISRLKKDIEAARTQEGVYLQPDNYNLLITEYEEGKKELLRYIGECSELDGRVKELERLRDELEAVYSVTKRDLEDAADSLEKSKVDLQKLYKEREIHQDLIDKYDEAQTNFEKHARALSNALDNHISEHRMLRTKVHNLYNINLKNEDSSKALLDSYNQKYNAIKSNIDSVCKSVENKTNLLRALKKEITNQSTTDFKNLDQQVKQFEKNGRYILECIKSLVQHIKNPNAEENGEDLESFRTILQSKFNNLNQFFNDDFAGLTGEIESLKIHCDETNIEYQRIMKHLQSLMFGNLETIVANVKQVQTLIDDHLSESNYMLDNCMEYSKNMHNNYKDILTGTNQELDGLVNLVNQLVSQTRESVSSKVAAGIEACDNFKQELPNSKKANEKFSSAHSNELQALINSCEQSRCILTESSDNLERASKESQNSTQNKAERIFSLCNCIKMDSEEYKFIIEDLIRDQGVVPYRIEYLNNIQLVLIKNLRRLSNEQTLFTSNTLQEIDASFPFIANNAKDFAASLEKMEKAVITSQGLNKSILRESWKLIAEFVESFEIAKPKGDTPHKDLGLGPFKTPRKISKSLLKYIHESSECNGVAYDELQIVNGGVINSSFESDCEEK